MKVTSPGGDQMQASVHPFSEDLNDSRDAADGASTGTEFQSRIADGKECRCVSSVVGDLKPVCVPSGVAVAMLD